MSSPAPLRSTSASRSLSVLVLAAVAAPLHAWQGGVSSAPATPIARHARPAAIAGRVLPDYPWTDHVNVFFEGAPVAIALDPLARPEIANATADVYVVAHLSPEAWETEPALVDVRGAPQTVTFGAAGVQACTFTLTGTFSGAAGLGLGVGYDVVVDLDRDGLADAGDLLDGFGSTAGFYSCRPTGVPGPLAVTEVLYSGGTWLGQDIYYPTNIASLGQLPLVVVSHGNGHNYTWYDHIGTHLASWGFIVMSHTNDTMPGIETASTTTLTNTDHFLGALGTIAGGALNGHVDGHKIVWIGHSRGGEGVCRAYDRIFDGTYTPIRYTLADIKLVSSIAPTDFLGAASANPHAANYHLWVGGADADVDGCAASDIAQSYPLLQRSTGYHQSIELHGAGHGAFHDGGGSTVQTGPCPVSRADVHAIMKPYLLPLVKRYVEGNVPAREFLWRPWETFQSPGVPTNTCVVVDLQYFEPSSAGNFVLDDFQTNTATSLSSSGGAVTTDVPTLTEGRLDDPNTVFTYVATEPMNGMTEATATDTTRGLVFAFNTDRYVQFDLPAAQRDLRAYEYFSLRGCQLTRAPETTPAPFGDLQFDVFLVDTDGDASSIRIGAYGGGLEEPYQRSSCGSGIGWNNEWEIVRMRLEDFTHDGSSVDLDRIASVQLRFGPSHGELVGRVGIDDLQFMRR
ncbi:MAG: hypothetical protein IPJ77_16440 [Planctomycetes bacterium]|nr:hypothetical protein [Planctomycetota bacterium]